MFKSWKFKILFPVILLTGLFIAKYIMFDFSYSTGKRVGNLTRVTERTKFFFYKTWEGTISTGVGDDQLHYFSIKDASLAKELYEYEGREVVVFYEHHLVAFPHDTKYNIVSWAPKEDKASKNKVNGEMESEQESPLLKIVSKTLFCTFLGSLYENKELYQQVKEYIKTKNLYIYKQYESCNEK